MPPFPQCNGLVLRPSVTLPPFPSKPITLPLFLLLLLRLIACPDLVSGLAATDGQTDGLIDRRENRPRIGRRRTEREVIVSRTVEWRRSDFGNRLASRRYRVMDSQSAPRMWYAPREPLSSHTTCVRQLTIISPQQAISYCRSKPLELRTPSHTCMH